MVGDAALIAPSMCLWRSVVQSVGDAALIVALSEPLAVGGGCPVGDAALIMALCEPLAVGGAVGRGAALIVA